jgi:hypothetical protein
VAKVVVAGAIIACDHGGKAKLMSGDSRLTVGGNPAVAAGMEAGVAFAPGSPGLIAPCPHTTAKGDPAPCAATVAATSGVSTLWKLGDKGVLTADASGLSGNPDPPAATAKWSVSDPGQTLLDVAH